MPQMIRRLTFFIMVAFSLTGCRGPAKSFAYKFGKPESWSVASTLHTMPDGALLVVTKPAEHPNEVWKLRRIAAWDTSQPREDKLDVDVGPNNELLFGSFQEDRWDRNTQFLMDPGGNYLVVRLSQNADTWNQNPNVSESTKPLQSVLNIIDLQRFKLLRRVVVTDPLLAAGDMGFSPKRAFVVSGLQEHTRVATGGNVTDTGENVVQTLTLPELKPETICRYRMVMKRYSAQAVSTPEESRWIEEENQGETQRELDQRDAASKACEPRLASLGFSSLEDVSNNLNSYKMHGYMIAELGRNIPQEAIGPSGCDIGNLSADLKYAVLDCDNSHVQLTLFPFSRNRGFKVFRLEDGKQIMYLKLPGSPQFSGVVAASREVTYVVLLRDGAELEGYRVP